MPDKLKYYPELCSAALRVKADKELCLWHELRALNSWNSGVLPYQDALQSLQLNFGYSRSTLHRLLLNGRGQFWEIKGSKRSSTIQIYGLYRVCLLFGITRTGAPVTVQLKEGLSRAGRRALLYSATLKPIGSNATPCSRAGRTAATGVSRRQQQRYDKLAGNRRDANFAVMQSGDGYAPVLQEVFGKSRSWVKQRRLGNTYHSRTTRAAVGAARRVNALLRRSFTQGEALKAAKRFFHGVQGLIKHRPVNGESFLFVNGPKRLISGRLEWCVVS